MNRERVASSPRPSPPSDGGEGEACLGGSGGQCANGTCWEFSPWSALEAQRGLSAIRSVWREKIGAHFDLFNRPFLQPHPEPAAYYPCRKCGCAHEVTIHAPGDIVAVCSCEPWNCDNLILSPADIVALELNWGKLARALRQAFALQPRIAEFGFYNTQQIGAWSADAVPVILTIQHEPNDFRQMVMGLTARLRGKFILLSPTNQHLDAFNQEMLRRDGAGFFALDTHVVLTEHGQLQSRIPAGELFAAFNPEAKEPAPEKVARQAFALVKSLDAEQVVRKLPVFTVFRLYCVEGLTKQQIASRCHCALSLVYSRLELLAKKLGRDPAELRRYSAHFENIESSLSDSRAARIYRKGAIYGEDAEEEGDV